ncbi:hypothetical protein [Vibrio campbellii]|uniref:hypothetical protein n=1 Tax=Vibrio campbellii TaxID=680 RepID=UPI003F82F2E4
MRVLTNCRTLEMWLVDVDDGVGLHHNLASLKVLGIVPPDANELDTFTIYEQCDFTKKRDIKPL